MGTVTIYAIKNKINSKCYIGKSSVFDKRIYQHFYNASAGMNTPLYEDIRKYGKLNFEVSVLDVIEVEHFTDKECNELEQSYIHSIPSELRYNVMVKGEWTNTELPDKLKSKKIISINLTTSEVIEWDSIYKAALHFTGSRNTGSISAILSGKKKTLHGHTFRYA